MAADESAVLAIPITNNDSKDLPDSILAEVSFSSSGAMTIVMTEGAQVYSTKLSRKEMAALVKKSSTEWPDKLKDLMLKTGVDRTKEIVAVAHSNRMTVVVRECAEVPLKLCSFDVPESEDADVSLYDWTVRTVRALESERKTHGNMKDKMEESERAIEQAKAQLETLRESTQSQEKELLRRFCLLLNSKKDKIRQLQNAPSSKSSQVKNSKKKARRSSPIPTVDDDSMDEALDQDVMSIKNENDDENDDDDNDNDNKNKKTRKNDYDGHDDDDDDDDDDDKDAPQDVAAEQSDDQSQGNSSAEEDRADDTSDGDEEL